MSTSSSVPRYRRPSNNIVQSWLDRPNVDSTRGSSIYAENDIVECESSVSSEEGPEDVVNNVCRICHRKLKDETTLTLRCSYKDELGVAHKHCTEKWFQSRGSNKCEICQTTVSNVVVSEHTSPTSVAGNVDSSYVHYVLSLYYASDIVRLLLIKVADKTLKNQDGLTPLDLCLYSGRDTRTYELIKLLKQLPGPCTRALQPYQLTT